MCVFGHGDLCLPFCFVFTLHVSEVGNFYLGIHQVIFRRGREESHLVLFRVARGIVVGTGKVR